MNKIVKICIICIIILSSIVVLIYILRWIQFKILFQPISNIRWKPSISYHDRYIDVHTGQVVDKFTSTHINIWHFNNFSNCPTILYCHGNGGNISYQSRIIQICNKYHLNLLLFDYQGYGKSTGSPSIDSIFTDGIACYKYLLSYCCYDEIIIWGESLGGAVALEIAQKNSCKYLILFSTFSSLDDIIRYRFPQINGMLINMASTFLDNISNKDKIKLIQCNILIVHSSDDEIIPIKCANILYNNIKHSNKKLLIVDGGHNNPLIEDNQMKQIISCCHDKNILEMIE